MENKDNTYNKIEELEVFFEKINAISEINFTSDLELINYVMETVIESTDSHIGFFHFVNDDQESLELTTWSKETLLHCTAAQDNHYPISSAGIWVEAFYQRKSVVYNDYKMATGKKGVPEGHFPLIRFISTPIIKDDKVKSIVGIGNKSSEYSNEDVKTLELYMNLLWDLLENRKYKEQIKEHNKILENLYNAFDLLSEMIIITDKYKNVEFFNQSFKDNFGIRNLRFLHKNVVQLISSTFTYENTNVIFQKLDEINEKNQKIRFELENLDKVYLVSLKLMVIRIEHYPKIFIKIEDITEEKRNEEGMKFNSSLLEMHKECFEAVIYSEYINELQYQFCVITAKYLRTRLSIIAKLKDFVDSQKLIVMSIFSSEEISHTEPLNFTIDTKDVQLLLEGKERVVILDRIKYSYVTEKLSLSNSERIVLVNMDNFTTKQVILFLWDEKSLDWDKMISIAGVLIDRLKLGMDLLNAKKTKEKTEKLLVLEKKQLAINLNTISDGIVTLNNIGNIIYANKPLEKIFELDSDSVIGKKFFDTFTFYNEKFEKVLFNPYDFIVNDKDTTSISHKYAFITSTNKIRNIEIILKPIYDTDNFSGIVIIIKDLSELYDYQTKLNLAQKMETLGLLSAGIAHEINTPLQYVNDNLHFIKESFIHLNDYIQKVEINACDKENLAKIQKELETDYLKNEIPISIDSAYTGVNRIIRIIKAMKNFSHKSNNEKTLADINKLLEDTITITRNDWKSIAEIYTFFENPILEVFCLPDELMQVFLNLVINSVHAIKTRKEQDNYLIGEIKVYTKEQQNYIEIIIEDNGCGIPENNLNKIFEPFYTTKPTGLGTGQGLKITKDIVVNKHDGEIKATSKLNEGTKIYIYLPKLR